jgi:hypothetical protein
MKESYEEKQRKAHYQQIRSWYIEYLEKQDLESESHFNKAIADLSRTKLAEFMYFLHRNDKYSEVLKANTSNYIMNAVIEAA